MDRDLVERGRRGDREAYERLAEASVRRLYGVAHRILRDADLAEDATQQALVAIWLELPRLRDPDRFEAWTYRLVARTSIALARSERHRSKRLEPLVDDLVAPNLGSDLETRDALEAAFRSLSADHRAVVVLHHQVGLPLAEVAEILGIPYGTAGSRLHYAVQRLRIALDAQDAAIPAGRLPA